MGTPRDEILDVLRKNVGFDAPEVWAEYAIRRKFRRVAARRIARCPDCGAPPAGSLGQYVYYSTLIRLLRCGRCGLFWSDARIDPEIVRSHFDVAYKDEAYYEVGRRRLFEQISELVARLAPAGGRVLDVGGAKGHLMARVAARRPDLALSVSDVSPAACEAAASRFGLRTICGGVDALEREPAPHDVVVLSDVLYYEPEIARLWAVLPKLVSARGAAILRVPNRVLVIRIAGAAARLARRARLSDGSVLEDRIRFFNSEHAYAFTRRYLTRRLGAVGFTRIDIRPTPPLAGPGRALGASAWFLAARCAHALSLGALVLTPSLLLVALRDRGGAPAAT